MDLNYLKLIWKGDAWFSVFLRLIYFQKDRISGDEFTLAIDFGCCFDKVEWSETSRLETIKTFNNEKLLDLV